MEIFFKKSLDIKRISLGSKKKKFGEYLFRLSEDLNVSTRHRFSIEI